MYCYFFDNTNNDSGSANHCLTKIYSYLYSLITKEDLVFDVRSENTCFVKCMFRVGDIFTLTTKTRHTYFDDICDVLLCDTPVIYKGEKRLCVLIGDYDENVALYEESRIIFSKNTFEDLLLSENAKYKGIKRLIMRFISIIHLIKIGAHR